MKKSSYVIHPDNTLIIIHLVLLVFEYFYGSIAGFNSQAGVGRFSAPPACVIPLLLISLIFSTKRICITSDQIKVHYLIVGIKRTIRWAQISSIEYVVGVSRCQLFIAIDDCPSFIDSKLRNGDAYSILHPFKVITIRFSPKKVLDHLHVIKELYPNLKLVKYNPKLEKPVVVSQMEEL